MESLTFGTELADKVDKISSLSDVQLGLLSDLREMFRERVTLEKEYGTKLQALFKKVYEKKNKRMSKLVVGDEPTQAWTEETVKLSTFDNAYAKLLSSLENGAQDHMVLADSYSSQVVEELKKLERKSEEAKKKQTQFFEKLIADKDRAASDRLKAKHKYDEECMEVESHRHKQHHASDDKHAGRAAKHLEQQKVDMLNGKNTYLIAIAISNKVKNKFYEKDLPLLENQFQSIQAHLMTSLTSILQHSQSLMATHLSSLQSRSTSVSTALSQVDVVKDQQLFIEYNRDQVPFKLPEDSSFVPCTGFYDTGDINIDSAPKVFLQNKLSRCRSKLQELEPVLIAKQREAEKLEGVVSAYSRDSSLGSLDDVRENLLEAQHQLTYFSTSQEILTAEIEVITAALGDDEGAQRPHTFKSSAFSIPTQCGYCHSSIWGLSKQGKTCKICHIAVHTKCELKVPAECPGGTVKGHNRAVDSVSSLSRTLSHQSGLSHRSAENEPPTPSSFVRPPDIPGDDDGHPAAKVLFDFAASSPYEISVHAGETVRLVEIDDGSGWIKVEKSQGEKGLVPASYIELSESGTASPTLVDAPAGSGVFVRAIYPYAAQGGGQFPLQEGDMIELSPGPNGGQNYGDGWWEGILPSGRKGIFPSNYVELV